MIRILTGVKVRHAPCGAILRRITASKGSKGSKDCRQSTADMLVVVMLGPLATVDMIIAAPALAHDYERHVQSSVPMPIDTHAPGRGRLGMAKSTTICQAERTALLPALPPPPAPRPRRPSTRPSPARDLTHAC